MQNEAKHFALFLNYFFKSDELRAVRLNHRLESNPRPQLPKTVFLSTTPGKQTARILPFLFLNFAFHTNSDWPMRRRAMVL